MIQAALFPERPASGLYGLRDYQSEAVSSVFKDFGSYRSTLLVMATGGGKTVVAGEVAKRFNGGSRVVFIAHRDEILQQTRERLEAMTGEHVGLEKAESRAEDSRIVVASVQTLCKSDRLHVYKPEDVGLVIVDEAHHAVSSSYTKILDHFRAAKVLGVTATPDRKDEKAMGRVFDHVAYRWEIDKGIASGYLAPVRVVSIYVDAIDLRKVNTLAGDLNQGQLDAVMSAEEALHGVVTPTIEQAGERQTLVFTTTVDNAHRLAEIFNRYKPGSAKAVDGGTDTEKRRQMLADHKDGKFQFLCNVGVLTEGYDSYAVQCIAMARPTKSRCLYTQCLGRGLRPYPSTMHEPTADARIAAIAESGKPDCLVLDFGGNAGRHTLIGPLDILGGRYSDAEKKRAKKLTEKQDMLTAEALEEARAQLIHEEELKRAREAAKRAALQAKVQYRTAAANPFAVLGMHDPGLIYGTPASDSQINYLCARGVDIPVGLTKQQATKLIAYVIKRHELGLCTFKQMKVLKRHGHDCRAMTFEQASSLIDRYSQNWKRRAS